MKLKTAIAATALAAVGLAAAVVATIALATPASASPGSGGGGDTLKNWDTDNLRFPGYTSASFRIPSHDYGRNADRYSHEACGRGGVADGFYQTKADVNDFPVLDYSTSKFKVWGSSALPCDEFVRAQERMVSEAADNGGYWLDSDGNLRQGTLPGWIASRPGSLTYGTWNEKGYLYHTRGAASAFIGGKRYYHAWNAAGLPITSDSGYHRRLDVFSSDAPATDWAIYPDTATLNVVWGRFDANATGRDFYASQVSSVSDLSSVATLGKIAATGAPSIGSSLFLSSAYDVGGTAGICPDGFHPRGADSVNRIGNTTGRTLSHLTHAEGQIADKYWCRSDVRFLRKLFPYTRPGVALHPQAQNMSATEAFYAYGRVNCFYTANLPAGQTDPAAGSGTTGLKDLGDNAFGCEYPYHPLPLCDPDPDNGSTSDWRAYGAPEIADAGTVTQPFNKTAGADCANAPADPPQQAGFTADACVTASLEIYENRIAGSDAEPGVAASDRTLAVAAGRTAWDLDVTSPHPSTASAPRDTTSGSGDPDGCADGSESRADHASSPAGVARKQSPAPSYAASDRTDTAAPPNDADDDIDYSGAAMNMAHRYASRVAENTCAAKRAEANLRLALLEAEEKLYKDWMERYEAWAKGKKDAFGNWRPTNYPTGTNPNTSSLLSVHPTFYSFKHAKRSKSRLDYADAMSTVYETRETDAGAAASRTLTKPTVASNWCGDPAGFVKTYSDSVTALKTAADNATTAGTAQAQPSDGPTSTAAPEAGSIGVVDASKLSEGAARVPAEWGTSYTYAYTDSKGKRHSGSSGCWQAGTSPTFGAPDVTYTPGVACISKAAVPEVLASGTASSVTYASYDFTLSGGGWTRNVTVPAATSTAVCSSWQTSSCAASPSTHPSHDGYVSLWNGSLPSVTGFPSTTGAPGKSVSSPAMSKLLGKYYPSHADRANLKHTAAQTRNQAATDLGKLAKTESATITPTAFSNLAVPASNPATDTEETTQRNAVERAAEKYQDEYTQAYDNAYDQAIDDMGGKTTTVTRNGQTETVEVWSDFDWRYQTSTLDWGAYQEDPATTYSASTATPRDGTGCDLVSVASDGTVSVEATRLDYETSSYGKGSVYSARTDAQRTCKIRRTRTPELLMMYAPVAPVACTSQTPAGTVCGTDTSKTADSRLDTNTAKTNAEFFYVDYQPAVAAGQTAAERFKLYDEAEVFAVKTSLADSPPTFCASNVPSTVYVSHAAGAMSDMSAAIAAGRLYSTLSTEVLRPAGYSAGLPNDHCFSGAFANTANVKIAVFDDTAHSAMNLVYLEKDPADTSGITILASGGALAADSAVAYPGDSAQSSSFYGTTYSMPASLGSTAGWDVLAGSRDPGDPDPLDTKVKNRIVARDKPAVPNLPAVPASQTFKYVSAMGFNIGFLDCRPDVENVVFLGNITNATQASNQANDYAGITSSSGYPMDAPTWYYPPWSEIKGKARTDGSTVAVGQRSGIYTHPQSAQYGWVMETVNHISIDKQPISAFRNQPDVRRAQSARPSDVTLPEHREVCFGDRTAIPHYRSAAAATDPLGHNTDSTPQQAIIVWSAHNPICDTSDVCDRWQTRCYRNVQTPAEAERVDCPTTGQPPADTKRFADKAMVDANIVRVISADDLSDTETAAAEAAKLISYKAEVSDGTTTQPRWPWLVPGKQNIFDCETRWWYCLRTKVTLYGIDQFEWLKTRQLRIAFQYPLPKWGNVLVSTLDRDPGEQAVKVAVNILVQTVRIGL